MRRVTFLVGLPFCLLASCVPSAYPALTRPYPAVNAEQIPLPGGDKLSPAGTQIPLPGRPRHLLVSPSGKLVVVLTEGTAFLHLLRGTSQAVLDQQRLPAPGTAMAFGPDEETLYVAGGKQNQIYCFRIQEDNKLLADSALLLGGAQLKITVAGLAIDSRRHRLYAVTRDDQALYTFDLRTRRLLGRVSLGSAASAVAITADGQTLYIAQGGSATVSVYQVAQQKLIATIRVGTHPTDIVLSRDGQRLAVANAGSNSVSLIDTRRQQVVETLPASPPSSSTQPADSTVSSVAFSANEQQLFIANAARNCLAVYDMAQLGASHLVGFVPTGWQPSAVRSLGNSLLVANEKGSPALFSTQAGSLSVLPLPDQATLTRYSAQVKANSR